MRRTLTHHIPELTLLLFVLLAVSACSNNVNFVETFDAPGNWRTGSDSDVEGAVRDGVYDFLVKADDMVIWTTAGREFGDAVYEVEATQIGGPDNNGYGMLFRVDDENDHFYLFEISGDGFVWIGRYRSGGEEEAESLVGDWWFESDAVRKGPNQTNRLKVEADGDNLTFYINSQEVGQVTDDAFNQGDIGLLVRTLGEGDVHVQFDNFSVTPILQ
ncbi:MAG: family 16 glycoside hydrolase [Anaerolineae bacterium]